jgi:hypothetical protein
MSSLRKICCPVCHRWLCTLGGVGTLQLPCRHCRILVTVVFAPDVTRIMAAA